MKYRQGMVGREGRVETEAVMKINHKKSGRSNIALLEQEGVLWCLRILFSKFRIMPLSCFLLCFDQSLL